MKNFFAQTKYSIYELLILLKCNLIYESYPVITTLLRKYCENIITPPFQFEHLPAQVSKSLYGLKVSESAIIFAHLFGGLAPTDLFVSKKPKILKFFIRVNFET